MLRDVTTAHPTGGPLRVVVAGEGGARLEVVLRGAFCAPAMLHELRVPAVAPEGAVRVACETATSMTAPRGRRRREEADPSSEHEQARRAADAPRPGPARPG